MISSIIFLKIVTQQRTAVGWRVKYETVREFESSCGFYNFYLSNIINLKIINQWKYFEYNILYSTLVSTAVPKNIKLVHERYCFKEEMSVWFQYRWFVPYFPLKLIYWYWDKTRCIEEFQRLPYKHLKRY